MVVTTLRRNIQSHSGVGMTVTFGGITVGELQGISLTITREKAPNYVMGSPDPVAFSRGKRGIAGSAIFQTFDREALLDSLRHLPEFRVLMRENDIRRHQQIYPLRKTDVPEINLDGGATNIGTTTLSAENLEFSLVEPIYLDQLPPFDIVITSITEAGHVMRMAIVGCEVLNSGTGFSIDDITTDTTLTFVATAVQKWGGQKYVDADGSLVDAANRVREEMKAGSWR